MEGHASNALFADTHIEATPLKEEVLVPTPQLKSRHWICTAKLPLTVSRTSLPTFRIPWQNFGQTQGSPRQQLFPWHVGLSSVTSLAASFLHESLERLVQYESLDEVRVSIPGVYV